ncbi:MAG: UPF0175 family protein [Roseimicrobium sp.]
MKMTLEIPDLVAAGLPGNETERSRSLLLELACGMFAAHKLTHAQAARLAGMERLEFEHELGLRDIPIHYTLSDWKDDLEAGLCGD